MKNILYIFILVHFSMLSNAQYTYEMLFDLSSDERDPYVYHDKINDEQILIFRTDCKDNDTSCTPQRLIYTLNNGGDTIRWPFVDRRNDTMFSIHQLTRETNGDFFTTGLGWTQDSTGNLKDEFDYNLKWNSNYELIWENIHPRPPEFNTFSGSCCFKILKLINGNWLVGKTVTTVDPNMDIRYYFLEINSNNGTVIKEKILDLGGYSYLQGLTYSLDTSEIILHSGEIYMRECQRNSVGAVMLDTTTYDTLRTFCYNRDDDDPEKYWCVHIPYNAKTTEDKKLVIAGTGGCANITNRYDELYMFIYQYDSAFELLNRKFLTHQDTMIDAGWYESLDINENNEICVVGNHNRGIGPWNSNNSWIYMAKLNQDLELLSERYLGGDAYYTVYSMAATSDGGIVAAGTRFDWQVNDYERDAFVIKADGDLWVGQHENTIIPVHSAIIYPNPGTGVLNMRTMEFPSVLEFYNAHGQLVLTQRVEQHITGIKTTSFLPGVYVWILRKNNSIIDRGKWIKINN